MRLKSLLLFIIIGSCLFAQDIEVVALSVNGSVYVKKSGKRFAETIKLDTRYAKGSQIKTNENSSVELLLSDSSIITLDEGLSWVVGSDFTNITKRTEKKKGVNLWDMTIGMLDRVSASAANSNVVGSIRVTGNEEPLKNNVITNSEKVTLTETLKTLDSNNNFSKHKMSGFIYYTYKQYLSAETEYTKALELATNDEMYNQILDYIIVMLQEIDRPEMANKYVEMKK